MLAHQVEPIELPVANDVADRLNVQNWYVIVAVALTFIVQILRKNPSLARTLWLRIPDGWRWLVPVLAGGATGFTTAVASGLSLGHSLLAFVGGAAGIGFPAMGLAAMLRESPVKWDGGAGGKPTAKPPAQPPDEILILPRPPSTPTSGLALQGALLLTGIALLLALSCASGDSPPPARPASERCSDAELATLKEECRDLVARECGHPAAEDCPRLLDCQQKIRAWRSCDR